MRAIFIAVGSEMLEGDHIDTNSVYVSQKLMERGILTDMKVVVGDDLLNLSWIIKNAFKRTQLVILTGGLGPTEDDMTREAAADALKRELVFKEEIMTDIKARFKKRGMEMPPINTRQAFILDGAAILHNPNGTAPGQYIDDDICRVLLLPGPPHEMKPMFDHVLEERIAPLSNFFIYKRSMKFSGTTESKTDSLIADIYTRFKNVKTTILAKPGVIDVHLLGRSKKTVDEAKEQTDELAELIKEKLKDSLITEKDIPIQQFIVEELNAKGLTLSVAESCTGGGLGDCITSVPGCSTSFLGGAIAYSNLMKMNLLNVNEKTLDKHGAVSKETAKEMADGIRNLTGSDIAIAITGIAGPGGGSKGKPVGLVFMHLSSDSMNHGLYQIFPGSRDIVKKRTVNHCLHLIHDFLKQFKSNETNKKMNNENE
ncbi:MAG: competence/damage-inducible protein A [bacterium]|nr:competence/damage-inducible protein A [bacterium]